MKIIDDQEVKSRVQEETKVVGIATYPQYDSLDEAVNHPDYGMGEARILELLNAQVRTNAMNEVRHAAVKGPSKKRLRERATGELFSDMANSPGDYSHLVGDEAAVQREIQRRMDAIEAGMKASVGAPAEEPEDEDED